LCIPSYSPTFGKASGLEDTDLATLRLSLFVIVTRKQDTALSHAREEGDVVTV